MGLVAKHSHGGRGAECIALAPCIVFPEQGYPLQHLLSGEGQVCLAVDSNTVFPSHVNLYGGDQPRRPGTNALMRSEAVQLKTFSRFGRVLTLVHLVLVLCHLDATNAYYRPIDDAVIGYALDGLVLVLAGHVFAVDNPNLLS